MTDTPTPLPGNPEAEAVARLTAATAAAAGGDLYPTALATLANAQATLALAFETRTATLVALLDSGVLAADYVQVAGQVRTRLGLGGDDER